MSNCPGPHTGHFAAGLSRLDILRPDLSGSFLSGSFLDVDSKTVKIYIQLQYAQFTVTVTNVYLSASECSLYFFHSFA